MTQPEKASSPNSPPVPVRKDFGPVSNAALYLVFCLLAATGLAMAFRLDDDGALLLGVPKRDWATVHAIAALSVLSLVALHLWVNWPWIRSMATRLRWRTIVVASLGLALLALALLAPAH